MRQKLSGEWRPDSLATAEVGGVFADEDDHARQERFSYHGLQMDAPLLT